ncbi:glutathione S-transferase family protein [Crenobacter cavernae]|uniref:glutathione transferase n=1 Tax=Crenobacter cavernae TaxID=2290923 RepID=A0A345Y894_9NEIS|nr:glutathione S-transferase [Crenobacter cavernae]AXK40146.1 glutathione S-transferase [Crenobacter cavernae]
MITVHHLNHSRSQRVLWLLEELGLPYEIRHYKRDAQTMLAPPELKAVHPLGKSPVISDGDVVVAESGAIVEYLVDTYGNGRLKPDAGDAAARRRYTYWLHYAEGSAMPLLVMALVFGRLTKPPMPALLRPLALLIADGVQKAYLDPQLRLHLDYLEGELTTGGWFAGDAFSAADIQMSFPLEAALSRGALGERHTHLKAFLARIHDRPAYRRALDKGGPYELLR